MKKLYLTAALCLIANTSFAAADYSIGDAELDRHGNTVTQCFNTRGFYFEIGQPKTHLPYNIQGFAQDMPLARAIGNSLYPGWHAVYGQGVDQTQKITWIAKGSWTIWLQKLAFDKNLALIIDWKSKILYINTL